MNYKKIIIVAFFLLAILTIGSVSAQDDVLAVEGSQQIVVGDDTDDVLSYAEDGNEEGVVLKENDSSIDMDLQDVVAASVGDDYRYVAYVNDNNFLNGNITLSIDGKQYYNKEFNGTETNLFIRDTEFDDFVFEDFLGNHTVKLTYKDYIEESVVSFVFEPYFFQPISLGVGDSSAIIFYAVSNSTGNVSLYNSVYDDKTYSYDAGSLIGTYLINGSMSVIPFHILNPGLNVFYLDYTINGKNTKCVFDVRTFEKSKEFTSHISDTLIGINDSVTVTVTGHKSGKINFLVDGKSNNVFSFAKGTAEHTFSNFTPGQHVIYISYDGEGNDVRYSHTFILTVIDGDVIKQIDISNETVVLSANSFTFKNQVQKPSIKTIGGKSLKEGTDYTVQWSDNSPKNAGKYTLTVTGKEAYTGITNAIFTINKAANPLSVKSKTAKVKYSSVKKKAQTLVVSKVVTFTKKGQGTLTYSKSSGNSKISINKKTGKVTVKKGLKKGTYNVKIKIKAAGNSNYKASAYKTVTFKIIVK